MIESLDRVGARVCAKLGVPISLVTLIESDRQVLLRATGLDEPLHSERETPPSHSFCQYVAADREPRVIKDARLAPRVADNPAIPDFGVVACAGWPLITSERRAMGALCAIDSQPRDWSEADLTVLEFLAGEVMELIEGGASE